MALLPTVLDNFLLRPILRPLLRLLTGYFAIPVFRFLLRHILRVQTTDAELERDLEQWFRGAILMLAATANLENALFGWLPWHRSEDPWLTMLLRLLLAIGIIESMPDEDLFSILHRGPPKVKLSSKAGWKEAWQLRKALLKGLAILHLRRSSPVFVIMAVVFGGAPGETLFKVGWWCYGLACAQYLLIALITDRDRVEGLLKLFDREADHIRAHIIASPSQPPPRLKM